VQQASCVAVSFTAAVFQELKPPAESPLGWVASLLLLLLMMLLLLLPMAPSTPTPSATAAALASILGVRLELLVLS
jgi:hypothetical protein